MIVHLGVLVPGDLCPALARLARQGARLAAERDGGAALHPDVVRLLDELTRTAQAVVTRSAMSASEPADRSASEHRSTLDTARTQPRGERLTVPAVAGLLGCTETHVRRLARSGQLPAAKAGRDWLIERSTVDQYLARSR